MKLPFAACFALAVLLSTRNAAVVEGRALREEGRQLAASLLPGFIACPSSLLVPAGFLDIRYRCSPSYYNCLGIPIGQDGPLSSCDGELVRPPCRHPPLAPPPGCTPFGYVP